MDTQIKSEPTANQILDRVVTLQGQVNAFGERLHVVEIDVAVIKAHYATREDVANLGAKMQESISALEVRTLTSFRTQDEKIAQLEARLIRWFVGTAITLSAVVGTIAFSAAKFIH